MNATQGLIDWHGMFVPTGSPLELVVRGSLMYLLILAGFQVFRRDAGSLSVSDLLVVVLIADAAQNGMAGEYKSLTEVVIVVEGPELLVADEGHRAPSGSRYSGSRC